MMGARAPLLAGPARQPGAGGAGRRRARTDVHGAERDVGVLQVAGPVVALGAVVQPAGAAHQVALVADRDLRAPAPAPSGGAAPARH
jgi:hypothetical protein